MNKINVRRPVVLALLFCGLISGISCTDEESESRSASEGSEFKNYSPSPKAQQAPSYRVRRLDYERAIQRARSWLDQLEVDTVELTQNGVKGKKKLGEILAVYWNFYMYSKNPEDRARILNRVEMLTEQVNTPEYNNMLTASDTEFKQNSMSFLRVLWIMEKFGLDTRQYHEELGVVKPRMDEHFKIRGSWQRAMFASYYDRFDLEKPPVLLSASQGEGAVARRTPPTSFSRRIGYQLTHEVFVAYDYGNLRTQNRFDADDLAYLKDALPHLVEYCIEKRDPDVLAEAISSMTFLGFTDHPGYLEGINYLLDTQNPDGTWGRYSRQGYGKYVDQHLYLHTTAAAAKALLTVFER